MGRRSPGCPVVERDGRKTRFTAHGAQLLQEARLIVGTHDAGVRRLLGEDGPGAETAVVGVTEHGADQILPVLTEAVREVRPGAEIRFRIDRSARLTDAVDRGELDLAVYVTEATAAAGTPVDGLPLRWYAAPGWKPPVAPAPLPLVAINEPCVIRRRALAALAADHTQATVVAEAGYLAGVPDAACAGLGAALLAVSGGQHPEGLTTVEGLPAVSPVRLSAPRAWCGLLAEAPPSRRSAHCSPAARSATRPDRTGDGRGCAGPRQRRCPSRRMAAATAVAPPRPHPPLTRTYRVSAASKLSRAVAVLCPQR
ncbi:LysR substrate-binding domain-containing protein [Streptomyces sp. NPDC046859]|uniref:LysR substrate-binding domain-containing protein n=1 Tax=Streptomyces sp. NPDC046859 TaxID=3155734 RepID=UPI0033E8A121